MTVMLLAAGLSLMSLLLVIFYWIFEETNTDHLQRLRLLKSGILFIVLATLLTVVLHSLAKSRAVGTLLPNSILVVNGFSRAKTLAFTNGGATRVAAVLTALYLFGVALTLAKLVISFFRTMSLFAESKPVNVDGHLVFLSEHVRSPLSFGFITPKIYVPKDLLQKNDPKAISIALAHEEIHILNHDHRWKFVSLLCRAILFFAPMMNYLHRKLELEMEIECDRATMQMTGASVQEYGSVLIGFADAMNERQANSVFAYMTDTTLRRRIMAMKTKMVPRPILFFTTGFAILAIAAGTAVAASGANKLKNQFKIKTEISVDGKVVSSPHFVVIPKVPASLEIESEHPQSALKIELTAEDAPSPQMLNGIHLEMAIDYKAGGRVIRANPQILVQAGEEAIFTLDSGKNGTVEMQIIAERQ